MNMNVGSAREYPSESRRSPRALSFFALAALLPLLLAEPGFGQPRWEHAYGGTNGDAGYSVQQTSDSGYIVAGTTSSFGAGFYDVYLVRTDAAGETLWTRTYGGTGNDFAFSVQQTSDGGYIAAGYTFSYGAGGQDFYLVKTDAAGETLWTRTYGGTENDRCYSVEQTSDSGYILTGSTRSFGAGGADVYLIKTDAAGETLWTRTYGGDSSDHGYWVQQTSDGGYIVTGPTHSFGSGAGDVYLIRTDALGETLWTRTCGGAEFEWGNSVQQTSDGGFIVGGGTLSFGAGDYDLYLVKTDASGDTLWTRTYGGTGEDAGSAVQQTSDGGYVLAGYAESLGPGSRDVYLVKTNAAGETLWTVTYGGTNDDLGNSVQQTSDGGYIVAGGTRSFGAGNEDVYLIKTDAQGQTGIDEKPARAVMSRSGLSLSAEPSLFTGRTVLTYRVPAGTRSAVLVVWDISGRLVRTFTTPATADGTRRSVTWDGLDGQGQRVPAGCYFCILQAGEVTAGTKMLLVE